MPEPRIWILPQEVAERIAAGEVVERPASVVKELVENALDAGARRITVETESGGKGLIRVTDDGCGMTAEEVGIALQRHATSKLRSAEDLFNIHTLGFRGEALPSIAAVSELEVLTRTPESGEGTRILVEGGTIKAAEAAAAKVGTSISVRRLFFNVPVREKFLRSDSAEAGQITDVLQRLALSHPEVSFRLVHDGREALLSPGSQDPLNTVVSILGRPVARELLKVPPEEGAEIQISGFTARPTLARANRALQHFYVNGRAVRSPLFYKALDDAYRSSMPQGRYPVALLFIQVPTQSVDVNVHPAKTEVRFADEWAVHGAILRAVQQALRTDPHVQAETVSLIADPDPTPRIAEPRGALDAPPPAGQLPFAEAALNAPPRESWRARPAWPAQSEARDTIYRWQTPPPETATPPAASSLPAPEPSLGELRLLGQVHDLFILAESRNQLWIIDQHVAHERVLFDRLTAPHGRPEPAEPLLIPAGLDVDRQHALALEEHRSVLAELGFGVEPYGPTRYVLRSVPRSLLGRNYEAVFRDLADELAEQSRGGQVRLRKEEVAAAAAGRSCKSAVKAGMKLSTGEMERLLEELRFARNPYTCPHGRPVFLTYEEGEVARLFGDQTCG